MSRAGNVRRRKRSGGWGPIFRGLVLYSLAAVGAWHLATQGYTWAAAARAGTPPTKPSGAVSATPARPAPDRVAAARSTAREEPAPARRPDPAPDTRPAAPPSSKPESRPEPAPEPMPPMEIARGAGHRPEVALTFDAGADWKPAKQILVALAAEGVHCTFFLTGEWAQANPKTARLIAENGHEIGNHSWDHPAFTGLTGDQVRDQLRRTDALLRETTGRTSRPLFRPPLGARDPRVRKLVGDEGYLTVYWSLDSRDSVDVGITSAQVRDRVLAGAEAGSIVLLHCGSQATANAVPEILKGLRAKGLTPVTVGRLLQE